MHATEMVNATDFARDDRQLSLPFVNAPANDDEPIDDPFAICRWEDDGGAIGMEDVYGE
jgi:hypothetical protein